MLQSRNQINVETTMCFSTLKFTTLKNVKSTLHISTMILTTLDNVKTKLLFSTSSFTTLINFETKMWKSKKMFLTFRTLMVTKTSFKLYRIWIMESSYNFVKSRQCGRSNMSSYSNLFNLYLIFKAFSIASPNCKNKVKISRICSYFVQSWFCRWVLIFIFYSFIVKVFFYNLVTSARIFGLINFPYVVLTPMSKLMHSSRGMLGSTSTAKQDFLWRSEQNLLWHGLNQQRGHLDD